MDENSKQLDDLDLSEWKDWQKDTVTKYLVMDLKSEIKQLREWLSTGGAQGVSLAETGANTLKWTSYIEAIQKVIMYIEEVPEEVSDDKEEES